jgi:putative hydrolase of the HAD superfamily
MIHDMPQGYLKALLRCDSSMARLRYPLVLFDAGDTLIGPRESFGAVYARVLGTLGVVLPAAELERGLRLCWAETNRAIEPGLDRYAINGGGEDAYWLRFVAGTLARTKGAPRDEGLAASALTPLREAFRDPESWHVFDDVVPVLATLRAAGARLGVVSNWDSGLPALLGRLGLASWFDTIVVSHLEGMEKPSPELFLRAVARLGGSPGEALHVGDVPELDGAGATAAGIASVIVDRRARLGAEHETLADLSTVPGIARGGEL